MLFGPGWGTDWNTTPARPYLLDWKEEDKPKKKEAPAPRCSMEVIKKRRLRELHLRRVAAHPDKGGSHEEFILANAEYEAAKKEFAGFAG